MEVREINSDQFYLFIKNYPPTSGLFLQTPDWLEFEKALGFEVELLGFYTSNKLEAVALLVERVMKGGFKYWYAPRGPLFLNRHSLSLVLQSLIKYYENQVVFLRIEPPITDGNLSPVVDGLVKTIARHPPATQLTDLSQSPETLLKNMHPKTRYNINLSLKKSLNWSLAGSEAWPEVWDLFKITAERDQFSLHTASHYETMLNMFGHRPLANDLAVRIALVKNKHKLLAASILVFSHGIVTYLHGASSNQDRELMPTYFLHFRTIIAAQKLGFKFYDWWGVATDKNPNGRWLGITRFKTGFGGSRVDYMGTWDYPYNKILYALYKLAIKLLR